MLKRRFWVFQPTVLRAIVMAIVASPEPAVVSMRASMPEVDFASTMRAPAVTWLSSTSAVVWARTTLVTSWPLYP